MVANERFLASKKLAVEINEPLMVANETFLASKKLAVEINEPLIVANERFLVSNEPVFVLISVMCPLALAVKVFNKVN